MLQLLRRLRKELPLEIAFRSLVAHSRRGAFRARCLRVGFNYCVAYLCASH